MRRTVPKFAIACVSALALLLGWPTATATANSNGSTSSGDAIEAGVEVGGALGAVGGVEPASSPSKAGTNAIPNGNLFWELQMNLCNSGVAGCYEGGRAVPEAQSMIESTAPDLVTLNEICRNDITPLYNSLRSVWGATDATFWSFVPAYNSSGSTVKCANGYDYGNGMVGRMFTSSTNPQLETFGYIYGPQDDGNERRTALCSKVHNSYWGCTTHLSNRSGSVAMSQCQQLMSDILPSLWASHGYLPSVMGGDLNMRYNGSPNVQNCVPSGWYRKGDGGVQHVMFRNIFEFRSSQSYSMQYTDHPAWMVRTVYNP